jgi:cell division protein ZapA
MDNKKQMVLVNILGEEYPIRADAEKAYIIQVAKYVDTKMREVSERVSTRAPVKVAVLAALNIADELFKERVEKEKRLSDIEERAQSLIQRLDNELIEQEL